VKHGKASSLGVVSGIVAGLVAITPAAGTVTPAGAAALGAIAALFCSLAISFKNRMNYDDTLDVFGIHGVGGITGALFLTFFIRHSWWAEATSKSAGWGVLQQLGVQAKAVALTIGYVAAATFVLVLIVEKTIGFRVDSTKEMAGLDHSLHGETGYGLIHLD
jgi:Amt family ammonium transporter